MRIWMLLVAIGCRRSPRRTSTAMGWLLGPDCHDGTALVNPGLDEIPGDRLDNDCDPTTLDEDLDGDGRIPPIDCDETNADVPGPDELVGNGLDDDCDPDTSDELPPGAEDLDGDGLIASSDCDDLDPEVGGPTVWYPDCDGDGFAAEGALPTTSCGPPACGGTALEPVDEAHDAQNLTTDCNDDDDRAWPGQTTFFDTPQLDPLHPWDYDCDGVPLRQHPPFTCFEDPFDASDCIVPTPGYDELVGCGALGLLYADCTPDPTCAPFDGVEERQACR